MWKKILVWGLVIVALATVINDVGRYFTGWRLAEEAANSAAVAASGAGRGDRNRNKAWVAVYNSAAQVGAVAENVELADDHARAWVRYDVRGTFALAPIMQMTAGNWDVGTWWKTPVPIRSNARSMY